MSDLYEKYLAMAGKLKVPDSDLLQWVQARVEHEKKSNQQALEREERARERDKDRELELEKKKIDSQIAQESQCSVSLARPTVSVPKIKFAPLTPSEHDNIDLYLEKFERTCITLKIANDDWGTYLMSLLQGDSLSVLSSLAPDECGSYTLIKEKLLKRFGCDFNGFRDKFFQSRPKTEENFESFVYRTKRYFDRWLDLAKVNTYDGLIFLLLFETVMATCNEEFVAHIKDQSPSNIPKLIGIATSYSDCCPNKPFAKAAMRRPHANSQAAPRSACFSCQGFGHVAKGCPSDVATKSSRGFRSSGSQNTKPGQVCSYCHRTNHVRAQCFMLKHGAGKRSYVASALSCADNYCCCIADTNLNRDGVLKLESAKVFGRQVSLLRDTGCNTVAISAALVPANCLTGRVARVNTFCCQNHRFPTASIFIESDYFTGNVDACIINNPVADVILGNIAGIKSSSDLSHSYVGTRSQSKREKDSQYTQNGSAPQVDFAPAGDNSQHGVLHRVNTKCQTEETSVADGVSTNVLGEYSDFSERQRLDQTLAAWYKKVGKAPVNGISFVMENGFLYRKFQRPENRHYEKTLCIPESLRHQVLSAAHDTNLAGHAGFRKTLATIKSEFSWPGLSTDTLSFVRSCHICQVKAPIGRDKPAPFQTMPIIFEPFSRVVIDLVGPLPVSSNRYEYILTVVDVATRFADAVPLRSITAKNVGENLFSIFTRLGFPKQVQSDQGTQFMSQLFRELSILSGFEHKISTAFHPETNAYVERFHGTLKTMLRKLSHERPSDWDSRNSLLHVNLLRRYVRRVSSVGCNISLTAPQQCGPSKDDVVNAFAQLPLGKTTASQDSTDQTLDSGVTPLLFSHNVRFEDSAFCCVSVSEEASETFGDSIPTPCTAKKRSAVKINPCLDAKKVHDIQQILDEFTDVLTSSPGHTTTVEHNIILTNSEPVRVRPYPLPFASQAYVREEITKLLDMGVIEPSSSAYCSPIVLVKKKDNTLRLCIDFRKINTVTQFDANNIPLPEDLFMQLSQSTFFTSCDLSKAYWQISLSKECRHIMAFQTPLGLMHWCRMPFGLVGAPAQFIRLMHIVLKDCPNLLNYFDDTLVHTPTWVQHPDSLRTLFTALRKHGLTVNPAKLSIRQTRIEFLGHVVSNGTLAPLPSKVQKVVDLRTPTTKKQVQSLMGLELLQAVYP
ncbi:scan domain-containing protein 3 [Plakobranchus ocellatus]|uniref:Scan domain-containing protein 3 n=1 Tax=Plakobranchus ocellatus TaxID=259542 RepID=A0AAV4ABD0_9GAST|nr:scan domain-containing protein 3 [Plakobranchus ocellatus]